MPEKQEVSNEVMERYSLLREKCKVYMKENSIPQSRMAAKIGIGESTLSRWLKGTYPNGGENISDSVELFLAKAKERNRVVKVGDFGFAMTTISQEVWGVLEYTRIQKMIGIVYGDAGVGKTFTAKKWIADKPDVVMLTANPAVAHPKPFFKTIAKRIKLPLRGTTDDIYMDIIDRLEFSDLMLVIDEAQHLAYKTLELVRNINDVANTAIVFIGNDTIYNKMVGNQQAEFAQLFSRLGMRGKTLTDMFTPEDVQEVFNIDDDDCIDTLLKICRSRYGLRGAMHVFTNANNNGDISATGIKAMAAKMGISA